jgi:hypothetical protein
LSCRIAARVVRVLCAVRVCVSVCVCVRARASVCVCVCVRACRVRAHVPHIARLVRELGPRAVRFSATSAKTRTNRLLPKRRATRDEPN